MPKLVVIEGANRGAVIPLQPGENGIGRDTGVPVSLPDRSVSRRHATIFVEDEGRRATLSDLGSTNATYVNGVRLTSPQAIAHGDEVRCGDTVLLFLRDDDRGPGDAGPALMEDTSRLTQQDLVGAGAAAAAVAAHPLPRAQYMVGESEAITRIAQFVARCAPLETTTLISGETGTGKELVAEALHRLSPRRDGPFIVVNCATLEPALLESELFGHERGAFTGAVARKLGKLELVRSGTLFLDEVGELPPEAQAKLLRAIDKREFTRLGGHEVLTTGARFVAATHRDLPKLVRDGKFREDLLFRLRVIELRIPPLRERVEDIEPLARHFLAELRKKVPARPRGFTPAALRVLMAYTFPGNVRELKNIVERCLIFCDRGEIDVADLPVEVRSVGGEPKADAGAEAEGGLGTLDDAEKTHIQRALMATGWNKSRAAKILAIDRNTLHAKIKRHGLGQ